MSTPGLAVLVMISKYAYLTVKPKPLVGNKGMGCQGLSRGVRSYAYCRPDHNVGFRVSGIGFGRIDPCKTCLAT